MATQNSLSVAKYGDVLRNSAGQVPRRGALYLMLGIGQRQRTNHKQWINGQWAQHAPALAEWRSIAILIVLLGATHFADDIRPLHGQY